MEREKALSIYVHIPFCVKKCDYCDFLSGAASEKTRQAYVEALCREIEKEAAIYSDYQVKTVFFGGGTPTVLAAEQLERILCKLKDCFSDFSFEEQEISLECNPGTAGEESLKKLRKAGFNRLSIGLQSAQEDELKALGRIHSWEDFLRTYYLAREAGFHNINVDIMSALPGQRREGYRDTLEKVLGLSPEHISAYSLMIEEGTPFYERYAEADRQRRLDGEDKKHLLPSEEEERRMYELTGDMLKKHGYERYEISNYAKPGYACRHNLVYWKRGNYLGLGLGAASLIDNCRFAKTRVLTEYLEQFGNVMSTHKKEKDAPEEAPFHRDVSRLSRKEQMEEFLFLGLRLTEGISRREFENCFHIAIEEIYGEVLEKLKKQKLLAVKGDSIRLTEFGVDISNVVLAEFLL